MNLKNVCLLIVLLTMQVAVGGVLLDRHASPVDHWDVVILVIIGAVGAGLFGLGRDTKRVDWLRDLSRPLPPVHRVDELVGEVLKAPSESNGRGEPARRGDAVNHPAHYNAHPSGVECIDVVAPMGFSVGNAMKYLWRAGLKGDSLQDLRKARWYVQHEIERLEEQRRGAD